MKTLMLCLLLAGSFGLAAETGFACTCVPSKGPAEELQLAAAVFSGKVVEVRKHRQSEDIFARVEAVLRVERVWKGAEEATVSVFTSSHSAACGYSFKEGRTYLVYAHKAAAGRLSTGICGRTKRLKDAGEDLKELGAGREIVWAGRSKVERGRPAAPNKGMQPDRGQQFSHARHVAVGVECAVGDAGGKCNRLAQAWYSSDRREPEWRRRTIDEAEALFSELGFTSEFWRLPR